MKHIALIAFMLGTLLVSGCEDDDDDIRPFDYSGTQRVTVLNETERDVTVTFDHLRIDFPGIEIGFVSLDFDYVHPDKVTIHPKGQADVVIEFPESGHGYLIMQMDKKTHKYLIPIEQTVVRITPDMFD